MKIKKKLTLTKQIRNIYVMYKHMLFYGGVEW